MNRKNKRASVIGLMVIAIAVIGYVSVSAFTTESSKKDKGVVQMDKAMFLEKIYDFTASPDTFKFKGTRPAVVDFYADWCRPCKRVAPIMDELAETYKGKVDFYKVNVDQQRELAMIHNIQSIPVVILYNGKGKPNSSLGALNKEEYISLIEEILK